MVTPSDLYLIAREGKSSSEEFEAGDLFVYYPVGVVHEGGFIVPKKNVRNLFGMKFWVRVTVNDWKYRLRHAWAALKDSGKECIHADCY